MSSLNYTTRDVTLTVTGSIVTLKMHRLTTGTSVRFTSITNTTGITVNNTNYVWYYVVTVTTDTFQLSATSGGTAVTFGGTNGTGTISTLNYISNLVTFTVATSLVNYTTHPYVAGSMIRFLFVTGTTGITFPLTPESASYTWYYVINPLANSFQLATSLGGTAITFGGIDGSGRIAINSSSFSKLLVGRVKVRFSTIIGFTPFSDLDPIKFSPITLPSTFGKYTKFSNILHDFTSFATTVVLGKANIPSFTIFGYSPVSVFDIIKFSPIAIPRIGEAKVPFFTTLGSSVVSIFDIVRFSPIRSSIISTLDESISDNVQSLKTFIGITTQRISTYKSPILRNIWASTIQPVVAKLIQFWS